MTSRLKRWRIDITVVEQGESHEKVASFTSEEEEKILRALMSCPEKPDRVLFEARIYGGHRGMTISYIVKKRTKAEADILGHDFKNVAMRLLGPWDFLVKTCTSKSIASEDYL